MIPPHEEKTVPDGFAVCQSPDKESPSDKFLFLAPPIKRSRGFLALLSRVREGAILLNDHGRGPDGDRSLIERRLSLRPPGAR
jgi:hypothetical protein